MFKIRKLKKNNSKKVSILVVSKCEDPKYENMTKIYNITCMFRLDLYKIGF